MSKFLVTGGAGFIGSHIAEVLVKKGHFVRVLDNFSSGKKANLEGVAERLEVIEADIRDKDACLKSAQGMDFILHQAALRSVPQSMLRPHEYNEVNITGTLNMLEAGVKNKVKVFVFASSSSIYGEANVFPEKETHLPGPISPYALSKLVGEHYCRIFSQQYGIPTVALRYFNVFGPRQSLDDEYAVVIPKFIHCMLKGGPTPIYGNGRQSRDFTYIENVVNANLLAARQRKFKGEVFNVASGQDYTILKLVKALNRIMHNDLRPQFLPQRPGDVFKTRADISKAKRLLGLAPEINFMQGLKLTVEWFRKNA